MSYIYYVPSNVYDTLYQRVADQLSLFTTCLFLQRPMGKARIIFELISLANSTVFRHFMPFFLKFHLVYFRFYMLIMYVYFKPYCV